MAAKKVHFKGEDDDKVVPPPEPSDRKNYEIALQPQRIRTFYIEYVPLQPEFI